MAAKARKILPQKNKSKSKKQNFKTSFHNNLESKHRLLSYLMDNIPDVIYFKDKKGRLMLVNKAHAKGLGVDPNAVAGKTDFDFFTQKRASMMAKDDMRVMKAAKPIIDKIERATRPDGIDNYVSTTKIPMKDNRGKVVGLIGITRDITKRMQFEHLRREKARIEKKLEVLEELNKLESEFISAVSHELRTPLAIIKQLVTLVFNETIGSVNDKQQEALKRANDNVERLRKLIDDLLDISRIERGRLRLHHSLINLKDLFKESSDFYKNLAGLRGIELKYSLPKRDVNIFVDADRINQIITNLINNAIKFTEEGGTIKIDLKVLETRVRVCISDTGIGIAKKNLPHIFSKFKQVSNLSGAEKKGIGLGLSIVKELVRKHDGEIWVESQPGVGSKFYFTLPRFYTPEVLDKRVKEKIDSLLSKGSSVKFINLVIVDYNEFKEKIKIKPVTLFKNLKDIISASYDTVFTSKNRDIPAIVSDASHGKCSIIFSHTSERKVTNLAALLKDNIKAYFTKNKIDEVFIALGVLSYHKDAKPHNAKHLLIGPSVREIYIGSEMRQHRRITYSTDIDIYFPGDKAQTCQSIDLSEGGICFKCKAPLKTDSEVKIKFDLLKSKKLINTDARVTWIKQSEIMPADPSDRFKIGLEFMNLGEKDKSLLLRELGL
ncbi:ATP-binding protein [Candidatus Omnitrophota bacterium]